MFVADGGVFTQPGQLSMGVQLFFCEICGGGMCCLNSTLNILMRMIVFPSLEWLCKVMKQSSLANTSTFLS